MGLEKYFGHLLKEDLSFSFLSPPPPKINIHRPLVFVSSSVGTVWRFKIDNKSLRVS